MAVEAWINPNLTVIPKLGPSDLEKIVESLPLPNNVRISVDRGHRPVDYSALKKMIQEDNPETRKLGELPDPSEVLFDFGYMEKEVLLSLYRTFFTNMEELETKEHIPYDFDRLRLSVEKVGWGWTGPVPPVAEEDWERIGPEAFGLIVNVTPNQIDIHYGEREEPKIVSTLREKLAGTKAEIKIATYQR